MQQFKAKLKYVPTDAPQVCSSTSTPLNRDESLSVASKVLTLNNLEVDPPQHKEGQSSKTFEVPAIVCVLSVEGKPLMPCSPRKARVLLKKGEAHVVEVQPFFTIQLHKPNGNQVQKCSLGIDSGSKKIGYSVITEKKELVAGDVELDQKTSERLSEKRMNRSHRRNKLWYREPRFNNRKIPKGWLPPSIVRKFNTHINFINKLRSRLPINEENITITGLALYLGFDSRTSFYEYGKKEEFMYIIKRARLVDENRYENNLYSNACTGAIFALKNMDWHDKSEVDHTNKGEKFEPIDYTLLDDSVLRAIIKAGKPKES